MLRMSAPIEYAVFFRVSHPNLSPEDICCELNMTPAYSSIAGEQRKSRPSDRVTPAANETFCTFDLGGGDKGALAPCLRSAAQSLDQHSEFLRKIRSSGGTLVFHASWRPNADREVVFETDLLLKMAELGIELSINVPCSQRFPANVLVSDADQSSPNEPSRRGTGKLAAWQLDRVRKLVEGSPRGKSPTIPDLAALCGISPRQLTRSFKASIGVTIHNYIREVRLERAKTLLASSGLSLKEISAEAGFAGASHFAAEFRHAVGCPPSEYRAQMRGG
jgi:AraC-like DNA-binding protein